MPTRTARTDWRSRLVSTAAATLVMAGVCLMGPGPARAEAVAASAALTPVERSAYKTLTYQAVANLSDLGLFAVILGGSAATGSTFLAVNAVSAAALYFPYEYAWTEFGPSSEEMTPYTLAIKTANYRVLNAARNFGVGTLFGAGTFGGAVFVAANFVTDTAIYLTNETAWDAYRPTLPQ